MTEALLQVDGLKKHFPMKGGLLNRTVGHVKAVDGVSFSIDSGETLALIGESGSGKSTIARAIIGLTDVTEGEVIFDGRDISDPSEKDLEWMRSSIQMVFQDPTSSLNPRRTIGKSLEVPLAARDVPKQERKERILTLLRRVELNEEYLHKYPHELSGGQKQRVNIARAITVEPDLLLLDEPTSALDVSVQAKIIKLLDDLQDEFNLAYLFITHDLSLVRNIADRTAVLYLGQIQERGPTNDIFEVPTHPYTRSLLSAIPVTSAKEDEFKPDQEPLKGEIPSPRDIPDGCRFHTRCPFATDICSDISPELRDFAGHRDVRCHIYNDEHRDAFERVPVPQEQQAQLANVSVRKDGGNAES